MSNLAELCLLYLDLKSKAELNVPYSKKDQPSTLPYLLEYSPWDQDQKRDQTSMNKVRRLSSFLLS